MNLLCFGLIKRKRIHFLVEMYFSIPFVKLRYYTDIKQFIHCLILFNIGGSDVKLHWYIFIYGWVMLKTIMSKYNIFRVMSLI